MINETIERISEGHSTEEKNVIRKLLGFGEEIKERIDYWIERKEIPIGSSRHPYDYAETVPIDEIITIPVEPINMPSTMRSSMNILMLEQSGGGKSLLCKLIWFIISKIGYNTIYIDPKSYDSGRAIKKWNNDRLPPYMKAEGIKLVHYIPYYRKNILLPELQDKFKYYSVDIRDINSIDKWKGLGFSKVASFKLANCIETTKRRINVDTLIKLFTRIKDDTEAQLHSATKNSAINLLKDYEGINFFSEKYKSLNLEKYFKKNQSICISWNSAGVQLMSFDIGLLIKKVDEIQVAKPESQRIPTMFILDDASYFTKYIKGMEFNYSVEEIKNICHNYRSHGLSCVLVSQSLNIIDEDVADGFPIKIVSPLFNFPDSLIKIGIPKKAVEIIKSGELIIDRKNYVTERIIIYQDRTFKRFFSFNPPCNHFTDLFTKYNNEVEE